MARAFSLVLLLACLVASALSFAPAGMRARPSALSMQLPSTPSSPSSTRSQRIAQLQRFSATFAPAVAALVAAPLLSRAAEAVAAAADAAPVKVPLGPPPTNFGLAFKDFYTDCQQVVDHMRYAVQMEKGDANIAAVASKTKEEMNDFVSYYRRFGGISGKQSFSLLYTSVNVLAGHYTSYGTKFPVPEKRRKRLMQEFTDIEKNIRKKR